MRRAAAPRHRPDPQGLSPGAAPPAPVPLPALAPVPRARATPATATVGRPVRQGLALLVALGLLLAAWGQWAPLRGADTLAGTVVLRDPAPVIAHPAGGLVAAVLVAEGEVVAAGTPLIRLNDPALLVEIDRVAAQIGQAEAHIDGLRALLGHGPPPPDGPADADDPHALTAALARARLARVAADEQSLAAEAAAAHAAAAALDPQAGAVADQRALIEAELADQSLLLERGLTQAARVAALRREAARLRGQAAEIAGTRARLEAQAAAAEAEAARLAAGREADWREALVAATARHHDLTLTHAALRDRAAALLLTAPVDGRVAGLAVAGPGAVLQPGAPALRLLSPAAPRAVAVAIPAARVATLADRLQPGAAVRLRIPGPGRAAAVAALPGTVLAVAPAPGAPASARAAPALEVLILPDDPGALPATLPVGAPVQVIAGAGGGSAFAVVGATLRAIVDGR